MLSSRLRAGAALAFMAVASSSGALAQSSAPPRPALSARITSVDTPDFARPGRGRDRHSRAPQHRDRDVARQRPRPAVVPLDAADGQPAVRDGRRTTLPRTCGRRRHARVCAPLEAPTEAGALELANGISSRRGRRGFRRSTRPANSGRRSTSALRSRRRRARHARLRGRVARGLAVASAGLRSGGPVGSPRAIAARPDTRSGRLSRRARHARHAPRRALCRQHDHGARRSRGVWWVGTVDAMAAIALTLSGRRARAGASVASTTRRPRLPRPAIVGAIADRRDADLRRARARHARHVLAECSLAHPACLRKRRGALPRAARGQLRARHESLRSAGHARTGIRWARASSARGSSFPSADPLLIDVVMLVAFALLTTALMRTLPAADGPARPRLDSLVRSSRSLATPLVQTRQPLLRRPAALRRPSWRRRRRSSSARTRGARCRDATWYADGPRLRPPLRREDDRAPQPWSCCWSRRVWRGRPGASCDGATGSRVTKPHAERLPALVSLATLALAAWLAGGGLWLVRNEVRFGSPIAPSGCGCSAHHLPRRDARRGTARYYSVAGEPRDEPALSARRAHRVFRRTGGSGPSPGPSLALLILDSWAMASPRGAGRRLAGPDDVPDLRLPALAAFAAIAVVLLWLLVHAPWTSLEWTGGLSLRYALPIVVGRGFCAFVALFPRSWPWYARWPAQAAGWLLIAGAALGLFLRSRAAIPASSLDSRRVWTGPRSRRARCCSARAGSRCDTAWRPCLVVAAGRHRHLAARDAVSPRGMRGLVVEAQREEARVGRCASAGIDAGLDRHEGLYVAMLARRAASRPLLPVTARVRRGAFRHVARLPVHALRHARRRHAHGRGVRRRAAEHGAFAVRLHHRVARRARHDARVAAAQPRDGGASVDGRSPNGTPTRRLPSPPAGHRTGASDCADWPRALPPCRRGCARR